MNSASAVSQKTISLTRYDHESRTGLSIIGQTDTLTVVLQYETFPVVRVDSHTTRYGNFYALLFVKKNFFLFYKTRTTPPGEMSRYVSTSRSSRRKLIKKKIGIKTTCNTFFFRREKREYHGVSNKSFEGRRLHE